MVSMRPSVLLSGVTVSLLAPPLWGQEDIGPETPIIVTGERIGRTLAETASSVSVTSDNGLDKSPGLDRLDEILESTGNVTLGSGGLGPTIRGQDTTGVLRDLPAFLGGNRPRTTLIVDGRPASYYEFVFGSQPLWDVAKVEIFRSPQTTTQGRNSISGAIYVETAPPEQEFGAKVRATAGNYNTFQASAALTGALIEDELAFRISGDRHRSDSSSKMEGGNQAVDPNEDRYDLLRGKLLFTPSGLQNFSAEATYSHLESQAVQIEGIREPYRERRDPMARYGVFNINVDSLTFRPNWSLGKASSFRALASFGWADIHRFAPPGLGETQIKHHDRTLEAVLQREGERLDLLLGASHSRIEQEQWIDITTVGLGIGTFDDLQTSFGAFGEARAGLHERLTANIGLRYQSDKQRRIGALVNGAAFRPLDYDERFVWLLPKLSVAYDWSDTLKTGILVQRAANPGGITLVADTGGLDIFRPETLWDYEIFVRGSSQSGTVHYEANLFYYDMANAQRSVTRTIDTPGGAFSLVEIGNVPKAWSKGAELSLAWKRSSAFEIGGSIGFLDTKIVSVEDSGDPLLGKQFQRSPHFTGDVNATWQPDPRISFYLSFSLRSGYFDDDLNTPSRRLSGTQVLHARIEWQAGPMTVYAFVRNVFDRFYLTSLDSRGLATAGDPREFGLGVQADF